MHGSTENQLYDKNKELQNYVYILWDVVMFY